MPGARSVYDPARNDAERQPISGLTLGMRNGFDKGSTLIPSEL